jgi:hypothetical protein
MIEEKDEKSGGKSMKKFLVLFLFALRAGAQTITMGETNVLPLTDNGNANLLLAQSATLSQQATLVSLSFYVGAATGNLRLGIYDSTGPNGSPGNLVATTASSAVSSTGWLTLLPTTTPTLTPGSYWLVYLPSGNALGFSKQLTGSAVCYSLAYGAMPQQLGTFTDSQAVHWSFYATLMPVPTPNPPTPTPAPGQVTMTWNPPSTITGYDIFWGTTHGGPYSNVVNAGLPPLTNGSYTFTLPGLPSGETIYFVTESYDVNGNLSCPSNEASAVVP